MNLKSILFLFLMLIFFVLSWKRYTCNIKNQCGDFFEKTGIEKKETNDNPVSFKFNSDSLILGDFYTYQDSISSNNNDHKMLIVGKYFANETNNTSFDNLGLARANNLKNVLSNKMDVSKMAIQAEKLDNSSTQEGLFNMTEIRYVNDKTANVNNILMTADAFFSENSTKYLEDKVFEKDIKTLVDHSLNQSSHITIKGYSDNLKSEQENIKISKLRAKTICDKITNMGVNQQNITIEALGSSNSKFDNNSPEHRALNRRVVVQLEK